MKKGTKKRKTLIIIAAALLVAGIGFSAGMMAKESIASRNGDIGIEKAKEIALASVGVSAEKATFTKAVLDENAYEIDFYTSTNEYDFEIDADTGAIADREVSPRDLTLPDDTADKSLPENDTVKDSSDQQSDNSVIGVATAKSIALKHAGLSSASFSEASLDYDDGIRVYDLEFSSGNRSYEYEINAYTGKIIDYDVDGIDYDDDYDDEYDD